MTKFNEEGERTVWEIRLDWQYNSAYAKLASEKDAHAYIEGIKQWHRGRIFLLEVHERIAERINFWVIGVQKE